MKYAKIRKSVLQQSSDNGQTWNDVVDSEEEVMIRTFTSSTECESSPIGTTPTAENGVKAVYIRGNGTIDTVDCDSSGVYNGLPSYTFENGDILSVSIGNCVSTMASNHLTSTGGYGFSRCWALREINIPDSVTAVTDSWSQVVPYEDNYNIVNLKLPNNVKNVNVKIGINNRIYEVVVPQSSDNSGSWYYYPYLHNIVLKNRPTQLDSQFAYGTKLESFVIPDSVTYIGDDAFRDCTSLTSLDIPESVTTIGNYAFASCENLNLTSLPNSVEVIGEGFMTGNKVITSFTFSNISSIGNYSFGSCPYLKWVDFGESITTMGSFGIDAQGSTLRYVICRTPNPPTGFNALGSYPIYVPDEYVTTWQLALSSNSDYKYRIRPLSFLENQTTIYQTVSGTPYCDGVDKKCQVQYQYSNNNGQTWITYRTEEKTVESSSSDCTPTYRWVDDGVTCIEYDKWKQEKQQSSTVLDPIWRDTGVVSATTLIEARSSDCGYVSPNYFKVIPLENGTISAPSGLQYSSDSGETWQSSTSISATANQTIMFKGNKTPTNLGSGHFSVDVPFNIAGNPSSILYGDNFMTATTIPNYAFLKMFSGCTNLMSAENVELTASTIGTSAFNAMFSGCTSMTKPPMQIGTSFTTLDNNVCSNMFNRCSSLTMLPQLPSLNLGSSCYESMFNRCSSLTAVPTNYLPATTLANNCYTSMFSYCTSLTTAPELPATTLADYCYYQMFYQCSGMTSAPSELPATTLADSCYSGMFTWCSSLTTTPILSATTLVDSCYSYMFQWCYSVNNITCLATSGIDTNNSTKNWVSSVASNGTFTKKVGVTWPSGNNGIPSNWTVVEV